MTDALDRNAVLAGALMCLLVVTPAVVVYGLLEDGDASSWVFAPLLVIAVGYVLGGATAGYGSPRTPFLNGAAATVVGFLVVQIGAAVITGELSVLGLVFNALLAASLGVIGAGWGSRLASNLGRLGSDGESSG